MRLSEVIRVNTVYTRSINLERDGASTGVAHAYIPTTRAMQTLRRIADTMHDKIAPRARALIGPYGSGKSAFGLFLADLLGDPRTVSHRHAFEALREADGPLAKSLKTKLGKANAYCVALVTGAPEPLGKRLLAALAEGAEAFFRARRSRTPPIIRALREVAGQGKPSVSTVLGLVADLQKAVARTQGSGLLVVIDEAGKFLEYEARHRTAGESFLLQALAELACGANPAPMQLVVLMHQGFEAYARGGGDELRNEWRKVQGRFEAIPYLESTEQVLRVIASVLVPRLDARLRRLVDRTSMELATRLGQMGTLPSNLDVRGAASLFSACFPLHPISLLILPVLCQKVAQSERTLFTYLGSPEPFGFLDRLAAKSAMASDLPWILPWELYEYFVLNQPGLVSDHVTHRRWAEVVTALERLGDADDSQSRLLKTIGLLNLIGAQGGLKASESILRLVAAGAGLADKDFATSLSVLSEKSVVTFRRFNGEYRVWQGSDLDLEGAIRGELDNLGRLRLADLLNERQVIEPLVARRYSIEVGTLRFFRASFVEPADLPSFSRVTEPRVCYCLVESADDLRRVSGELETFEDPRTLVAVVQDAPSIREAIEGVLALERIQANRAELASDPIAQHELRDRLAAARVIERDAFARLEEEPQGLLWYWRGAPCFIQTKRDLQVLLSRVLEHLYPSTPRIFNELINRDKPSSAAVAARNKLLSAMLEHGAKPDLGIEKFPAEKAIYRSVLRATGIHHASPGQAGAWRFGKPDGHEVGLSRIEPLWSALERFLDASEGTPRPVSDLFVLAQQEPFGIKTGLLPILFLAMYLAYEDEVAIYEAGVFVPFVGADTIERAIKAPEVFSIERFKLDAAKTNLLAGYAKALTGEVTSNLTLLTVAKPLARFMMDLPEYVKRTNSLSAEARTLRDLFFGARSPAKLLFRDIPEALNTGAVPGRSDADAQPFPTRVSRVFVELRVAYHGLLRDFERLLAKTLSGDPKLSLDELRVRLRGRYEGLHDYTIDTHGLKAFIGRLTDPFGDESQWLISLGAFLGRKPPEKWSDDDLKGVEYRLADYAKRLRDLERLRLVYEERRTQAPGEIEVVLLKAIVSGKGESERLVPLDASIRAAIGPAVKRAIQALDGLPTDDLRAAALATLFELLKSREIEEQATLQPAAPKVAR